MKSAPGIGSAFRMFLCLLLVGLAATARAQVENQGPFCGRSYQNDASNNGLLYWVSPSGARCDEDAAHTKTDRIGQGQFTQYLHISDFGFSIPRDARISGIEVVVIRRSDHASSVRDKSVRLVRGGLVSGEDKAVNELWDTEWTGVYYGGEKDQWGGHWTAADLNRRDFGVVLSVGFGSDEGQPQVDEVVVTVHYSPSGGNVHSVNLAKAPSKFTCLSLGS